MALSNRMQRALRYGRNLLLGLVALVLTAGVVIEWVVARRLAKKIQVDSASLHIPIGDPAAAERGRYLVDHLLACKECHGKDLGGMTIMDNAVMGRWIGPNLTAGQGTVTGGYQGRDWVRAIRHGLARDGRRLFLMPADDYTRLAENELAAVVAYIQSLPPVDRVLPITRFGPVAKLLIASGELAFSCDRIDHQAQRPIITPGPTQAWGEVLLAACRGCHGPGLSGGRIPGGDPSWPIATNISCDHATGVGSWSFDDFKRAMQQGRRPNGSPLQAPMPWPAYAGMNLTDLEALWIAIRAAPPRSQGQR